MFINDPLERQLPPPGRYRLVAAKKRVEIDTLAAKAPTGLCTMPSTRRSTNCEAFCQRYGVQLTAVSDGRRSGADNAEAMGRRSPLSDAMTRADSVARYAPAAKPIGWWPLAPGWWVLIVAADDRALVACCCAWLRRRARSAARRYALRELDVICSNTDEHTRSDARSAASLSELLRRRCWPTRRDKTVAGLTGDALAALAGQRSRRSRFRQRPRPANCCRAAYRTRRASCRASGHAISAVRRLCGMRVATAAWSATLMWSARLALGTTRAAVAALAESLLLPNRRACRTPD